MTLEILNLLLELPNARLPVALAAIWENKFYEPSGRQEAARFLFLPAYVP